jgi:hypothetical protein
MEISRVKVPADLIEEFRAVDSRFALLVDDDLCFMNPEQLKEWNKTFDELKAYREVLALAIARHATGVW